MQARVKPIIFHFLDVTQFLKSHFEWRKTLTPGFSVATWAEEMGSINKVTLRFVLSQRRRISPAVAKILKNNLELAEDEGLCFDVLIAYSQAKTKMQRQSFGSELLKIQRRHLDQHEVAPQNAVRSVFGPVVLTLLTFTDFAMTPGNLAKLLGTSEQEMRSVLEDLRDSGLVTLRDARNYALAFPENKIRIPDNASLTAFYEYWLDRSKAALKFPFETRRFRSLKFALSPEEYSEAVEKMNDYALALLARFQSNEMQGRRLYMFKTLLFPISAGLELLAQDDCSAKDADSRTSHAPSVLP